MVDQIAGDSRDVQKTWVLSAGHNGSTVQLCSGTVKYSTVVKLCTTMRYSGQYSGVVYKY